MMTMTTSPNTPTRRRRGLSISNATASADTGGDDDRGRGGTAVLPTTTAMTAAVEPTATATTINTTAMPRAGRGAGTGQVISLSPPLTRRSVAASSTTSGGRGPAPGLPPLSYDCDYDHGDSTANNMSSRSRGNEARGRRGSRRPDSGHPGSGSGSGADFERRPVRREKSHDIDDEYFMGIPKNAFRGVGSGTSTTTVMTSKRNRRIYHPYNYGVSGNGDNGDIGPSSLSSSSSSIFSAYQASKMMNHKISLVTIQIVGFFLIAVMCLGVGVILQQGLGVVVGWSPHQPPPSPPSSAVHDAFVPPRAAHITPELIEKLHQDNQLQQAELENLKRELRELHEKQEQQQQTQQQQQQTQQQKEKAKAGTDTTDATANGDDRKDVLHRRGSVGIFSGDAIGDERRVTTTTTTNSARLSPVDEAYEKFNKSSRERRERQVKKLRGAAELMAEQLPPAERDVHLINRSPWEVQVFWISQNVIDYDPNDGSPVVQWMLLSGEEGQNISPSTTYHFHARPGHRFGIKRYPQGDSLTYVAPAFPQDQYIVLTDRFTISTLNDAPVTVHSEKQQQQQQEQQQ